MEMPAATGAVSKPQITHGGIASEPVGGSGRRFRGFAGQCNRI